jgi:hypothetical protein
MRPDNIGRLQFLTMRALPLTGATPSACNRPTPDSTRRCHPPPQRLGQLPTPSHTVPFPTTAPAWRHALQSLRFGSPALNRGHRGPLPWTSSWGKGGSSSISFQWPASPSQSRAQREKPACACGGERSHRGDQPSRPLRHLDALDNHFLGAASSAEPAAEARGGSPRRLPAAPARGGSPGGSTRR